MTRKLLLIIGVIIVLGGVVAAMFLNSRTPSEPGGSEAKLQVVAAENFWGSLVAQIGGEHANVVSVVSDPNADPHEYESNAATARSIANANYVIINGAGYDSWAEKLLTSSNNPKRKVLDVATLLGKKNGDNPHFWYSPDYVNKVSLEMEKDFISLDPANASYYESQYQTLQSSLSGYQNRIASIRQQFGGTKVAATEDIFVYLAQASGLDLISPQSFMQAVAEGNDPPTQSVIQFQNQLQGKEPAVLVYNEQTVTPLTDNMKKVAAENGIPVVGITETIQPPDASFEEWMNAELITLENALNAKTLGH